jgi:hypothetical protein
MSWLKFFAEFPKARIAFGNVRHEEIVAFRPNVNAQYSSKFQPQAQDWPNTTELGKAEDRRILRQVVKILDASIGCPDR